MAEETLPSSRENEAYRHHLRPSSRGGDHTKDDNVVRIHPTLRHAPYHRLFFNLWPHEAALLLFFCWETQRPQENSVRWRHDSLPLAEVSWQALFGGCSTPDEALRVLETEFAISSETRLFMQYVKKICGYAQRHAIERIQENRTTVSRAWREDENYIRLFNHLYPHEAILLLFLSWRTMCPYKERTLPSTLVENRGKKIRDAFRKRIDAWDALFGKDATPREVIAIIEDRFGGDRRSIARKYIAQAKRICRSMERSGLLQK